MGSWWGGGADCWVLGICGLEEYWGEVAWSMPRFVIYCGNLNLRGSAAGGGEEEDVWGESLTRPSTPEVKNYLHTQYIAVSQIRTRYVSHVFIPSYIARPPPSLCTISQPPPPPIAHQSRVSPPSHKPETQTRPLLRGAPRLASRASKEAPPPPPAPPSPPPPPSKALQARNPPPPQSAPRPAANAGEKSKTRSTHRPARLRTSAPAAKMRVRRRDGINERLSREKGKTRGVGTYVSRREKLGGPKTKGAEGEGAPYPGNVKSRGDNEDGCILGGEGRRSSMKEVEVY